MEGSQKTQGSLGVVPLGLGTDLKPADFPSMGTINRSTHIYLLDVTCVLVLEALSGFLYPLHGFGKVKERIPPPGQ